MEDSEVIEVMKEDRDGVEVVNMKRMLDGVFFFVSQSCGKERVER